MPDLCLEDAAGWLETEGALLDGLVSGAAIGDWQAVIDLIRSVGWWYDYVQDGGSCRLPARVHDIFALTSDRAIVLHVRPVPDVLVNFHFFSADTIDFDFDPRELQARTTSTCCATSSALLGAGSANPYSWAWRAAFPTAQPLPTIRKTSVSRLYEPLGLDTNRSVCG